MHRRYASPLACCLCAALWLTGVAAASSTPKERDSRAEENAAAYTNADLPPASGGLHDAGTPIDADIVEGAAANRGSETAPDDFEIRPPATILSRYPGAVRRSRINPLGARYSSVAARAFCLQGERLVGGTHRPPRDTRLQVRDEQLFEFNHGGEAWQVTVIKPVGLEAEIVVYADCVAVKQVRR